MYTCLIKVEQIEWLNDDVCEVTSWRKHQIYVLTADQDCNLPQMNTWKKVCHYVIDHNIHITVADEKAHK